MDSITREKAWEIFQEYNKDSFHLQHALTVECVMRWFAEELGFEKEVDYWGIVGLLHDIDFEMYPEEHCIKAQEILKNHGVSDDIIHSVCSHGYEITVDIKPEHIMEKVLYAVDELTGLIGAAALIRPSKSVMDMELKSLKKKYKDRRFAAGCSRDIIEKGADMLGWDLDKLLEMTIMAMRSCEDRVREIMKKIHPEAYE
jgi:putative nucleotidyltransferase with HDIG domain